MKTNKEIIRRFKIVLNAYFFPIKPYDTAARKEKIKRALEEALSQQRKEIIASVDYAIEGLENTIILCSDKDTIHNLKNNVLKPLEVLIKNK